MWSGDGKRAIYQAAITDYDAIILDVCCRCGMV